MEKLRYRYLTTVAALDLGRLPGFPGRRIRFRCSDWFERKRQDVCDGARHWGSRCRPPGEGWETGK